MDETAKFRLNPALQLSVRKFVGRRVYEDTLVTCPLCKAAIVERWVWLQEDNCHLVYFVCECNGVEIRTQLTALNPREKILP